MIVCFGWRRITRRIYREFIKFSQWLKECFGSIIINKNNWRIAELEENQKPNLQNKQEEFIATSIGTEAVLMPVHIE